MSYNSFASHYDKMMADVDYSWWVQIIEKNVKLGHRVLDVGCGTGTLSLALTELGYEVTGLDLSEDMLVMAREKAHECGKVLDLIHRDMRELAGLSGFDCVLIAVDSLNYLATAADVRQTFTGAHAALIGGGLLIFDVHTPKKLTETFKDYLYVENGDALTYIWHVCPGPHPLSVVHELTLFAKNEDGSYQKAIEHHHQRTFELPQYLAWLVEAGFELIEIQKADGRNLLIARKVEVDDETK